MAKPTTTYPWATGASATLEPDAGSKVSGFVANDKPPARWHNWLFNGASKWHEYLSNLHGESEFLNKAYTWTEAHQFASTVKLNGTANELTYATARSRTLFLPLSSFSPTSDGTGPTYPTEWQYLDSGAYGRCWSGGTDTNERVLTGEFSLPSEALIEKVRFAVTTVGATIAADWGVYSGYPGGNEQLLAGEFRFSELKSVTTTGAYDCLPAASNVPLAMGGSCPYFRIRKTGNGSIYFHWARVYFTDPGPRNF